MNSITEYDGNLLIGIQDLLNAEWLTPIMKVITFFGEGGYFWIAVCLILLCIRKTRRLGIICSLSLLLTFICCNLVIKPAVDRVRPWVVFNAVHPFLPPPGDASFPSGHSANSMGPAWALFISTLPEKYRGSDGKLHKNYDSVPCLGWKSVGADPKLMHNLGTAAVILAVLIGISRLYLGMHYPTDVVCGLLLGMICATIIHFIFKKIESSRGIIGGKSI